MHPKNLFTNQYSHSPPDEAVPPLELAAFRNLSQWSRTSNTVVELQKSFVSSCEAGESVGKVPKAPDEVYLHFESFE